MDLDSDHPVYRWPLVKARLDRCLVELARDMNSAAKEVVYGAACSTTISGTRYQSVASGYYTSEGSTPTIVSWVTDEGIIKQIEEVVGNFKGHILTKLLQKPSRLVWRMQPSLFVLFPPTDEEILRGIRNLYDPIVWWKMRYAIESLVQ